MLEQDQCLKTNAKCNEVDDSLPKYDEDDSLCPTSAAQNSRYDRRCMASTISLMIQPGVSTRPQYSPADWVVHINPEGSRYYVNSLIQTITDTPINRPNRYENLMKGVKKFQLLASNLVEPLSQQTELYIRLRDDDNNDADVVSDKCNYYIVDHDAQTELWLHAVDPGKMGILQITSESHVKYALQEHYWMHMEYFPHRPVPQYLRESLVSILRHAQLDMMTSSTSTFPYDVVQCKKMIKLVSDSLNAPPDEYMTCTIARIWTTISRHRYTHFYGEEHARLDRTQYVLNRPTVQRSIIMDGVSALCFGIPVRVNQQLEELLVDDLMYGMHWQKFMSKQITSWKEARFVGIALVVVDAILLVHPKGPLSTYIGLGSMALSAISLICSVALLTRYTGAEEQFASQGLEEIYRVEHPTLRYRPAATLYTLPTAFMLWSIIIFGIEVIGLVLECSTSRASVIMGILFIIFISVAVIVTLIKRSLAAWQNFRSKTESTLPV